MARSEINEKPHALLLGQARPELQGASIERRAKSKATMKPALDARIAEGVAGVFWAPFLSARNFGDGRV
jgi:hypothetical protein